MKFFPRSVSKTPWTTSSMIHFNFTKRMYFKTILYFDVFQNWEFIIYKNKKLPFVFLKRFNSKYNVYEE